ncbi:MAG: hypothetical protein RL359_19 [Actinomycetota bacterium]
MRGNLVIKEIRLILDSLPDIWTSWKSFFWTYPFSLIGVLLLSSVEYKTFEELLTWVLIATLSHLAMAPFILYGQARNGVGIQIFLVLLMGITRGAVIAILAPIFGVVDSMSFLFRVTNSAVAVFYWFQVGSILIHFMFNFRKDVKKLIEESILTETQLRNIEPDVSSKMLLTRISELQQNIVRTLEGKPTVEKLQLRAADIDRLIKEHLRPLSHSEWREGELIWVRAGFGRMSLTTLKRHPIPLWGIVALTLPFSLVGQFARYGGLETLVIQSLWILLAVVAWLTTNKFIRVVDGNFQRRNILLILSTIFFIGPLTFYAQLIWPNNQFTLGNILTGQVLSSISFALFCLITSLTLSLRADEKSVFRAISEQIRERDLQRYIDLGVKSNAEAEYAQYLHAEVQSQLLACKLLLLKAAEEDFKLFPPEVTQQILDRLEKIKEPYTRPPARLPSQRLAELANSWRGLAEIECELAPEIDDLGAPRDVISQLIEESVVNAIRHGKAKKILVKGNFVNGIFNFEISDDGVSDLVSGGKGLGTILFQTFASDWTVKRVGNQTIATFKVMEKVSPV